jgi:hypothetical protein
MPLRWIAKRLNLGAAGASANLMRDDGKKRFCATMWDPFKQIKP